MYADLAGGRIDIHANNEFAFQWACYRGHLGVAQWLWELGYSDPVGIGKIGIHADNEWAFQWACNNGHLGVAQWLFVVSTMHEAGPAGLLAEARRLVWTGAATPIGTLLSRLLRWTPARAAWSRQ